MDRNAQVEGSRVPQQDGSRWDVTCATVLFHVQSLSLISTVSPICTQGLLAPGNATMRPAMPTRCVDTCMEPLPGLAV